MGKVNAGVVLVSKFIRPNSTAFSGYIDYIDRDEAVRNEYSDKWNGYVDYMGNPGKTSEIFTAGSDALGMEEKQMLKEQFVSAQERGNLMWQTVISFDNTWLEEQGLYDSTTNMLDADKMKELTRNCMAKMLKKEGIDESAIWSAAIHYNTDNIHIHIATVEPGPTMRPMRENGESKGVWRQSTLNMGKASVVNNILNQQAENKLINDLIRKNIAGAKREKTIAFDRDLRQAFLKVYGELPANKQYWNYNSTNLGNQTRKDLDALSRLYIEKFHKEDFNELKRAVKKQQEKYETAYGKGDKMANRYAENKERELYERLGNAILKEMKEYDEEINGTIQNRKYVHNKLSGEINSKMLAEKNINLGIKIMGKAMNKIGQAMKRDIQNMKNFAEYEKLMRKIELQKQGYDIE